MAYDEGLAHRVRDLLEDQRGAAEKKMFGGLCFLVNGHMVCGIVRSELMVRVGADAHASALEQPHAREMDFTGRSLTGMVYVGEDGVAEDPDLAAWVARGVSHALSLPPRPAKKSSARQKSAKAPAKKAAAKKRASTRRVGRKA